MSSDVSDNSYRIGISDSEGRIHFLNDYKCLTTNEYNKLMETKHPNHSINSYNIFVEEMYVRYLQKYFRDKQLKINYDEFEETNNQKQNILNYQNSIINKLYKMNPDQFCSKFLIDNSVNIDSENIVRLVSNDFPLFLRYNQKDYCDWFKNVEECWRFEKGFTKHLKEKIEDEFVYEEEK